MASKGTWTVIFDDQAIQKGSGIQYSIDDDTFWGQQKFSNIWAIQYGTANSSDEVEYRDNTAHTTYADANLGSFNEFINRWDAAHLVVLQTNWDNDNVDDETPEEKITRLGPRPTSYSSI